ncbi:MAG: nickel insertion protein, partial [Phascolarctobacterium sp.]|uniref:nickel insertion protein n=1 Tax=Phascolarctobacterium sp. TaxID=2049039 RepID=UPI003A0FF4C1
MMKSLYLECNAGISGDMLVAALLDLGADKEALDKALQSIPAKGFEHKISRVSKAGVDCCDFDVILDEEHANHDHDMAFLHGNGDAVVHSHEHEHH